MKLVVNAPFTYHRMVYIEWACPGVRQLQHRLQQRQTDVDLLSGLHAAVAPVCRQARF